MTGRPRFQDKVAVVTGAASGMGAQISRSLVAEGAKVVLGDLNIEGAEELARELGDSAVALKINVAEEAGAIALVGKAVDTFGRLDLAYNVAGVGRLGDLHDFTEEDWDFVVDICLKGVFLCMKHQVRQFIAQGEGGAILNVASANSHIPMWGNGPYSAAKAGVAMLGQCGALEWGDHGIRVNTISPGLTETPLASVLIDLESSREGFMERTPLRTYGTPQDMADAALFLTSDESRFITGVNLGVDGGIALSAYPDLRKWIGQIAERVAHDGGGA